MADVQLRKALQNAFHEVDKDRKGHVTARDLEAVLRRYWDSPESHEKLDDARLKEEADHFLRQGGDRDDLRLVTRDEFIDYYTQRILARK